MIAAAIAAATGGHSFTDLDGPFDDAGRESRFLAIDLQGAREIEHRVHPDQLALVVGDFENVTGFDFAKLMAGLIEAGNLRKVTEVQVMTAEQLVERIATANREGQRLVLRLGSQNKWHLGKDPGLFDGDLGAGNGAHLWRAGGYSREVRPVERADQEQPHERDAQTHDKPLQGPGLPRSGLRRWLVIVQQRAGWAMQVGIPAVRDAAILLWRFVEVKENCYKSWC